MEIVIEIAEKYYTDIKESEHCGNYSVLYALDAIRNGTPLPKQHGDLIDKDRLLDELEKTVKSIDDTNKHLLFWDRAVAHVHLSKPIIAAAGGKEDGDSN